MRLILAATGWVVLAGASIRADDKSEPVAALIEKLSSADYKVREAANKALIAHGVDGLPEMKQLLAGKLPPEARKRLGAAVDQLTRIQILSPKRVTVRLKDRPVAEVIQEIARQSGYAIQCQNQPNTTVTIDMEKATFWEAMDYVCNMSGMTLYHNDGQGLTLYQNEAIWPHVDYKGAFKVTANSFNYNRTINLGPINRNPAANASLRNESMSLSFTLHAEPKLPLMNVGQARLLEAVDNLGNSMKPETADHQVHFHSYMGNRTFQYGAAVNLLWPDKEARIVRRLRGVIPVTLLSEQRADVVVEDLLKVKAKKFTGESVELTIDEVTEQNNKTQYHIKLSAKNLASGAQNDYTWTNSVHQRIEVLDAKGNKYFPQGYNWHQSSQNHVQATLMFGNNGNGTTGPPARLIFNQWVLMQHTIEFEFKDLNLP